MRTWGQFDQSLDIWQIGIIEVSLAIIGAISLKLQLRKQIPSGSGPKVGARSSKFAAPFHIKSLELFKSLLPVSHWDDVRSSEEMSSVKQKDDFIN